MPGVTVSQCLFYYCLVFGFHTIFAEGVNYQSEAKTALHSTNGCRMDDIPFGTRTGTWDTAQGKVRDVSSTFVAGTKANQRYRLTLAFVCYIIFICYFSSNSILKVSPIRRLVSETMYYAKNVEWLPCELSAV